jgi:acetyl esterase
MRRPRYDHRKEDRTTMDFRADDIEYQSPDGQPLLARLYQPIGPGPFPAVLEVHGGAWTGGDRLNNVVIAEALAADGIVVMSIDFRMPPAAGYPDTIADVNFGIRWLKANAEKFHSRADLVGGLGSSSGGHMLLLSALRPNDPRYAKLPLPGSAVDASLRFAIGCWPVADPLQRYQTKKAAGQERFVIAHDKFWPSEAAMAEGSPTLILGRGETVAKPPMLIMQGTADDNLTPDMADNFAAAYARAGGAIRKEIFAGEPHAFISAKPTAPNTLRALEIIKTFVHEHTG